MAGILKYLLKLEVTLSRSVEHLKELIRLWHELQNLIDEEAIADIEAIAAKVEAETKAMEGALNQ